MTAELHPDMEHRHHAAGRRSGGGVRLLRHPDIGRDGDLAWARVGSCDKVIRAKAGVHCEMRTGFGVGGIATEGLDDGCLGD